MRLPKLCTRMRRPGRPVAVPALSRAVVPQALSTSEAGGKDGDVIDAEVVDEK